MTVNIKMFQRTCALLMFILKERKERVGITFFSKNYNKNRGTGYQLIKDHSIQQDQEYLLCRPSFMTKPETNILDYNFRKIQEIEA